MNNILVTGANGQLGSELQKLSKTYTDYKFHFTDIDELDITDEGAVIDYIDSNKIDAVFNCAAYTAVDAAEDNQVLADAINHLAVANIAQVCKKRSISLIHISTDYIFDGNSKEPYLETDLPNPKSVYGKTKLDGERAILKINPMNTLIIRTSWVYSSFGNNFVKTMLRLGKERSELNIINDQIGSPTYAKNLAEVMLEILPKISNEIPEILNYSNDGVCSWYDFAQTIFKEKNINITLKAIESKDYPTKAERPFYSVLNKSKIKEKYQIEIPHWKDALKECLTDIDKDKD